MDDAVKEREDAIEMYEQDLVICRELEDRHGEGLTLANLGLLHFKREQIEQAVTLWREALEKLHPDSPEYAQVAGWLEKY